MTMTNRNYGSEEICYCTKSAQVLLFFCWTLSFVFFMDDKIIQK